MSRRDQDVRIVKAELDPRVLSEWAQPRRCGSRARSKDGLPCTRWAFPFSGPTGRCKFHGGWAPNAIDMARQRANQYAAFSTDPQWFKRKRGRDFALAMRRVELQRARKRGPEFEAALLAEFKAADDEERAWKSDTAAANRRIREQRRQEWLARKAADQPVQTLPYVEPAEDSEADYWTNDWGV